MVGMRHLAVAALVVVGGLAAAPAPAAGPPKDCPADNGPCPTYSCLRYWSPCLAHACDNCSGRKLSVYPPDRHPEAPPTVTVLRFPCPAAYPAATLLTPPAAPAESRFRY